MAAIAFLLGLLSGLGVCWWQRSRLRCQLQPVLTALPDTADLLSSFSLPLASLVRREMTYLKQQNQQLQGELQTWEGLMEAAPIGYLRVDGDNQLLSCNRQARQLMEIDRWQPGQVRLLLELVRSYELDRLIEGTRQAQEPRCQEWTFHPKDYARGDTAGPSSAGRSLLLKASSYPLPQGQVGVFIENRQPLADLSRSRERVFSDLSHELRTPLTAISLVAEVLQKRLPDPERHWIEQIARETQHLMALVQAWLDLGRLQENPSQSLSYQPLDLRALILEVWQRLQPLAQAKQVTLTYRGPPHLDCQGDPSRLAQVFLNLLDNGIEHSPSPGEIQVIAEAGPPLQVQIVDAGEGFVTADLPYVFDRFYRGDPSRTRPASHASRLGSGLGLAIAREIIEAHGGSITAENHPQTGGAWLQLRLPPERPG